MDVSSHTEVGLADINIQHLTLNCVNNSNENNSEVHDELAAFRQQWQRELEPSSIPQQELPYIEKPKRLTDEEKAKRLFRRAKMLEHKAIKLERADKLYKALLYYNRAVKILPDVEMLLYEEVKAEEEDTMVGNVARLYYTHSSDDEEELETDEMAYEDIIHPSHDQEKSEESSKDNINLSDDQDTVEGEDLMSRLNGILWKDALIEQDHQTKGAHISWLPYEVILVILRWVVSSELDAASLERAAAVCRGLYVAAREPDIWRSLCVKTWGIDCGTPRARRFPSWRQMFVERPRLNLNGVYICQTSYDRLGEHSFTYSMTRPLYHVKYFRYFRFFPEGLVLLWTTSNEPAKAVGHLKYRQPNSDLGIWAGQYRLVGKKVVIVMKRTVESSMIEQNNPRYRLRHHRYDVEPEKPHEQIFLLELSIHSVQNQRNARLVWSSYSIRLRNKHWTQIEVKNRNGRQKFPSLNFSRVRSYTADSHAPLSTQCT